MTTKLSLIAISAALLFLGCAKDQAKNTSASDLVRQAQQYFSKTIAAAGKTPLAANYRAGRPRTVLWDSATVQHFSDGDEVIAPIYYGHNLYVTSQAAPGRIYRLDDLTSLVISRDSTGHFSSAVVTFIPDSSNSQNAPHGAWFVEDWQGNTLYSPVHSGATGPPGSAATSSKEADYNQSFQVCDDIYGYNYSPDDPEGGVAWSETTCTTYGIPAENPAAGMPPSRLPLLPTRVLSSLAVIVAPPSNPISSIADYFKCFTLGFSPGQTYTVQVCVDQPDPGTRQPWGLTEGGAGGTSATGNPVNTGHTFLVLTENDQGNIISRNVGFYPSTFVFPTPVSLSSQGALNNDQSHTYNISITISISSTQFFNMLSYAELGNNTGYYYNLNTNNCTTFALNVIAAGGVTLPATQSTWPGGAGYDPGDLGEDLRNMTLSSNLTRNTVENDHPNIGNCN